LRFGRERGAESIRRIAVSLSLLGLRADRGGKREQGNSEGKALEKAIVYSVHFDRPP
jgi:hypothetical protein